MLTSMLMKSLPGGKMKAYFQLVTRRYLGFQILVNMLSDTFGCMLALYACGQFQTDRISLRNCVYAPVMFVGAHAAASN